MLRHFPTQIPGRQNDIGLYSDFLTSNFTTTLDTAQSVTGLSFLVRAGERWKFRFSLRVGCSGGGGVKYDINGPASPTLVMAVLHGNGASATAMRTQVITAFATLTTTAQPTIAEGFATITGAVIIGATAGTIQLRAASGTATQTTTIFSGSDFEAWRVAY